MRPSCLAIIGLGAIGGSLALRAAKAGIGKIRGHARRRSDAVAAAKAGAVTEIAYTVERVIIGAELVVLAAPPAANISLLERIAPALKASGSWCTDVSSVKGGIVRKAAELGLEAQFAGSHPFTGTHASGFDAAREDLLRGATVYVTSVGDGGRAESEIADFWERVVGAHPVAIDAAAHDSLMAWTSHLPQAVASALAVALGDGAPRGATFGPGARSTTRLAASNAEIWTDVLIQNRDAVLLALREFDRSKLVLFSALEENDADGVRLWLESGAAWRRKLDP